MNDYVILLDGEYLAAANELRAIAAIKKNITERETICKRIIEKHLAVGERGVTPDGEEIITIRAGAKRFDAGLASENLPPAVLAQITTLQVDAQRAKTILAPALFDLCCTENRPSVIVL
jgi:hypothetical protein